MDSLTRKPRPKRNLENGKTLYCKAAFRPIPREYRRLLLVKNMFVGDERIVAVFSDTGKRAASTCWIHPSFVKELTEMLGPENVAVK
jgi:hypothetical protein